MIINECENIILRTLLSTVSQKKYIFFQFSNFVHLKHIFRKQIPNWRKWPQFESCQMYIFKIYSSSTIHQTTSFNLKCIFVHSHAHPLSKDWLSQHIFKKQIASWRKLPQFESCQMYIFKIYSSSTIHQTTSLQPQMHICPLPCTPFEQKIGRVSIFLKNRFQFLLKGCAWELTNMHLRLKVVVWCIVDQE